MAKSSAKSSKSGSMVDRMKQRIKESGMNRKEIFYVAPDGKRRIRFLTEFEDAVVVKMHSHWDRKVNAVCLEHYGKDCPYCADTDDAMKEIEMYAWPVFDYEANATKILIDKVFGATPVPSFMEFYEEKETIMDRDYTVKKNGKGQGSSYTVMPGEISKFRNKKAKVWNEKQIMKILAEAFKPNEEDLEETDDEDEMPKKKKSNGKGKKTTDKDKGKKKKKTLRDEMEELEKDDLRNVAIELGISKKDLKGLDIDEILDLMFDDYDEEDIQEIYDDYTDDSDDEESEDEDEEDDD